MFNIENHYLKSKPVESTKEYLPSQYTCHDNSPHVVPSIQRAETEGLLQVCEQQQLRVCSESHAG